MMKTGIRRNALALLLLLISSVALIGSVPGSTAAGTLQMNRMLQMAGIIQQQNFNPPVLLDQPLFKVNVPLNVSNMPGPWKHAKLMGAAQVYFLDATGDIIGVALSEGSNADGELFEVPLNNGSYSGTVVVPIRVVQGKISGKTCGISVVWAVLGDQMMFIGLTKGGTAPNSGDCGQMNTSSIEPGTIMSY